MTRPVDLVIGPARTADDAAIGDVVGRAFTDQPSVVELVELVRGSPQHVPELTLVGRVSGAVVGFVMLSHAELVDEDGTAHEVLTLSPLAVAPERQRQGIGSALVRAGLAAADATGAGLVTLEGSPDYYGRLGFRFAPDLGVTIDLPDWAPRTAAQAFPLRAYDARVRGRLVYPPAFDVAH